MTGIVYVRMEVALHGLDADTPQEVADRVDAILREAFDPESNSDVEVELMEYAGTPREPPA